MTKDEALKLALGALEVVKLQYTQNRHINEAITAIKEALAQPEQEPVAWYHNDFGSVELSRIPRAGWKPLYTTPPLPVQLVTWTGNGSAERRNIEAPRGYFFQVDRRKQPEERNFCQRCGKRIADLITIHTCTPPQENT